MTIAALAAAAVCVAYAVRSLAVAFNSRDEIALHEPHAGLPSLSVIVPLRDEERNAERCLRSLLAQRYPDLEVIAVDDESRDATPEILQRLACEDPRLRVVRGAPLPPGWLGKPWALVQGVCVARGAWLLFTDADTVHAPLAAASAVGEASARGVDGVSLLTTQQLGSLAERALLPTILWVILLAVGGTRAVNDPRRRETALFNGQYLLMRRDAYEAIGGHAAVRAEIAEDYELAHLVKRDGRFRVPLLGARDLVCTRMYQSAREIREGFVKNLALGARGRWWLVPIAFVLLATIAPVTPVLALAAAAAHEPLAAAITFAGALASVLATETAMRIGRFPPGSGLWLPAGMTFLVGLFAWSVALHLGKRGVRWRGRLYAR